MAPRIDWTDDQLRAAVSSSASWRTTASVLGLARGSTHRIKRRAAELGLDVSHMTGNRRWDRSTLVRAVDGASTWEEVVERLGTAEINLGRVRGAAVRMGVSTDHLARRAHQEEHPESPPDARRLSRAAESFASAWFLMTGCTVSVPTEPAAFDLVVLRSGAFRRVQVKSTTHRDSKGHWAVITSRRPYVRETLGAREPYDQDEIDDFFIINGAGECFLIPLAAIAGRIGIVLDHYREYRLGSIGQIFVEDVRSARDAGRNGTARLA